VTAIPPQAVFVSVLSLALIACGGHAPVDPALAAFVSSDTVALAGVHLDRLRTAPLYRKLADENRLPRFEAFRTESGFDPSRDVSELLLASDGQNALAIARGTFAARPSDSLQATDYKGFKFYAKDAREVIAFVNKNTALGGSPAAVRAAIDQWKAGRSGAPAALMARARALPADAQIWAVVSGWRGASPEQLRQMGNLSNIDRMLRSVEGASLTIDVRSGAHAALTGDCRTEADARNLGDSLRGLSAFARMAVPRNRPELQHAFDGLRVQQDGSTVRVNLDITEDVAEELWH
jgi:hypothetical protein